MPILHVFPLRGGIFHCHARVPEGLSTRFLEEPSPHDFHRVSKELGQHAKSHLCRSACSAISATTLKFNHFSLRNSSKQWVIEQQVSHRQRSLGELRRKWDRQLDTQPVKFPGHPWPPNWDPQTDPGRHVHKGVSKISRRGPIGC